MFDISLSFNITMDASSIYFLSINIVASVGVLGNTLILCVLLQKHKRNTFNKLRAALAVFDSMLLGNILLGHFILKLDIETYGKVSPYFLWPMKNFAQTASMFMTMAIAIDRLIAIRYPHKYNRNQRLRATKYVLSVTITAMVLNLTKFNEFKPDASGKDSFSKHYGETPTSMLKDMGYAIYEYAIFKFLIAGLIPITTIIFSYGKIFVKLRENRLRLERSGIKARGEDKRSAQENHRARLFAGVVVTSLICYIPEMILKITLLVLTIQNPELMSTDLPQWVVIFMKLDNFFITLNSAFNIIIYSSLGKPFREECKKFFRKMIPKCKCQRNRAPSDDTIQGSVPVPEQQSGPTFPTLTTTL